MSVMCIAAIKSKNAVSIRRVLIVAVCQHLHAQQTYDRTGNSSTTQMRPATSSPLVIGLLGAPLGRDLLQTHRHNRSFLIVVAGVLIGKGLRGHEAVFGSF